MKVTIRYSAQARLAAGASSQEVELPEGATVEHLLKALAAQHGPAMAKLLLDEAGNGHPSVLVFVDEEQVRELGMMLHDKAAVMLLSPIAGG